MALRANMVCIYAVASATTFSVTLSRFNMKWLVAFGKRNNHFATLFLCKLLQKSHTIPFFFVFLFRFLCSFSISQRSSTCLQHFPLYIAILRRPDMLNKHSHQFKVSSVYWFWHDSNHRHIFIILQATPSPNGLPLRIANRKSHSKRIEFSLFACSHENMRLFCAESHERIIECAQTNNDSDHISRVHLIRFGANSTIHSFTGGELQHRIFVAFINSSRKKNWICFASKSHDEQMRCQCVHQQWTFFNWNSR